MKLQMLQKQLLPCEIIKAAENFIITFYRGIKILLIYIDVIDNNKIISVYLSFVKQVPK